MVLAKIFPGLVGAALLFAGSASMAADYRADEFLGLDLSTAVLSPKPLGPAAEFAPVPVEAKNDLAKNDAANSDAAMSESASSGHAADVAQARAEPKPSPRRGTVVTHVRTEKPHGAARTRLAHRHGNPLDAQALDTRIQTWPCKSGGICDWKP
jgi:hypothetical protein